jgi:SAM-dependent methyltransferase
MLIKIKQFLTSTPESDASESSPAVANEVASDQDLAKLDILIESQSFNPEVNEEDDIEYEYEPPSGDDGYILHSTEVVGYDNRERQFTSYGLIADIIGNSSILDFGCGRGDFKVFHAQRIEIEPSQIDYTGIDMNEILINAGKELYPDIDIRVADWLNMPKDLKKEWCINVNSLNLRYDKDLTKDDWEYFKASVKSMYNCATSGVAVMLASDLPGIEDGLINYNPGDVINWTQKEFGGVAIDHSYSTEMFTLIIYK